MSYEHKPGSFSLFKNSYKEDGGNRPDYKGSGKDTTGRDIEVAAWLRDGKEGQPRWLSCQIKLKESKPGQNTPAQDELDRPAAAPERQPEPAPSAHFANMKDDIPFINVARGIAGHVA